MDELSITEMTDPLQADLAGVARFECAMRIKLAEKRAEGRHGWNNPEVCSMEDLAGMLTEQINKGNYLNAANFCMMLWNRENPIA